jgi:DNA-binding transcriptional LysR family regulator
MERFFADRRFEPRIDSVMNSNETIKQAVMADMGIALLSRHTIGLELATGLLVELDVQGLPLMRRWYLVQRAGRFVSPATAAFVDYVVANGANLVAGLHRIVPAMPEPEPAPAPAPVVPPRRRPPARR